MPRSRKGAGFQKQPVPYLYGTNAINAIYRDPTKLREPVRMESIHGFKMHVLRFLIMHKQLHTSWQPHRRASIYPFQT